MPPATAAQPANGTAQAAAAPQETSVPAAPGRPHLVTVIALYAALLVFGVLQGLVGSFQFSRGVGPVPVAALCFVLAIGATCWLCGRGDRSVAGALIPAVGWIVASYSMALPNTSGSVVITNSIAGEVYLYGGALCAAIGVGAAFGGWTRALHAGSSPGSPRPLGGRR